jgi:hypothetical protein
MIMATAPPPMMPSAEKKGNNCLIGCLVLFGFSVVAVVFVAVVAYVSLKSAVDKITDTEPMAIQQVELSEEEQAAIEDKVAQFIAAINHEENESTFMFTGDELNALIGMFPETEWLDGAVYLQVIGSRVFGDVSFPLSRFGIPGDRYINGQATFEIGLTHGQLAVYITELAVKGEAVSPAFMQGLSGENLAQGFNEDIEFSNMLGRIKSVVVSDSQVIVKLYN